MTSTKQTDLLLALIDIIYDFDPEYVSQSEEAGKKIWGLIDSILEFEKEVAKEAELEKQKQDTLTSFVSDSLPQ